MNEYLKQKLVFTGGAVFFLFCLWLIIDGQRTISYPSLLQMFAGLIGILVLLWLYNRSHK